MAKVLLVDDDANVRLTLMLALRRFGHDMTTAGSAEDALSLLALDCFDWVVSDVRMPGMSGVELAARTCNVAMPDSCLPPRVVLLSAYSDVETPGTVVAFFQKPVDTRELSDLLHRPPQSVFAPSSDAATPPGNSAPDALTPNVPRPNPHNPRTSHQEYKPRVPKRAQA